MTLIDLQRHFIYFRLKISVAYTFLVPDRQEAQLSQRDRATLRVIEYFAKSLKVIRNDTVE